MTYEEKCEAIAEEKNEHQQVVKHFEDLNRERLEEQLSDALTRLEDVKANADYQIEGRDIKIRELEQENNKLLDVINNQDVKIADLESENAELKERYDKVDIIGYDALKNLTKAKEIIKFLINPQLLDKPQYYEWRLKAEQFLQEIEK